MARRPPDYLLPYLSQGSGAPRAASPRAGGAGALFGAAFRAASVARKVGGAAGALWAYKEAIDNSNPRGLAANGAIWQTGRFFQPGVEFRLHLTGWNSVTREFEGASLGFGAHPAGPSIRDAGSETRFGRGGEPGQGPELVVSSGSAYLRGVQGIRTGRVEVADADFRRAVDQSRDGFFVIERGDSPDLPAMLDHGDRTWDRPLDRDFFDPLGRGGDTMLA